MRFDSFPHALVRMTERRRFFAKPLSWAMGLLCGAMCAPVAAWTPVPVREDINLFMPGSQSGSAELDGVESCAICHADVDPAVEPTHLWRGSMMAQAMRDPIFLACMATALQDSIWALGNPNAGDLCLRCHTPPGWLAGRSDPPNGSRLTASDHEGVQCNACHQMMDPFPALRPRITAFEEGDPGAQAAALGTLERDAALLAEFALFDGSPYLNVETGLPVHYGDGELPGYVEATGGQYFIDDGSAKRGPRHDGQPFHDWLYSGFHRSREFCGTCHDVSNPALANVALEKGLPERQAAGTFFHVERTWSEFRLSAFGRGEGAAPSPEWAEEYGGERIAACQDCHMRPAPGQSSRLGGMVRPDVRTHDFAGGNAWVLGILASADPEGPAFDPANHDLLSGERFAGARVDVEGLAGWGEALLDGRDRALRLLQAAADLVPLSQSGNEVALRVQNHSGHKLISGFPEGRRMWLHVRFFDAQGRTISEVNPYAPLVVGESADGGIEYREGASLRVDRDDLVYEAQLSSELTGEEKTFHFALATDRFKDNRIPPRGFDIAAASERLIQPRWKGEDAPELFTAAEYAGGWDDVTVSAPAEAAGWEARLYYQTTSKEYVEFLRDEIGGTAATLASPTPSGEDAAYIAQTDPFFEELKDWGEALWELWLRNDGAAPVLMARAWGSPSIHSVRIESGQAVIEFQSISGWRYRLEQTDRLLAGDWVEAGLEIEGDGALRSVKTPLPPARQQYFRLAASPRAED